jgi:hypothetical protein
VLSRIITHQYKNDAGIVINKEMLLVYVRLANADGGGNHQHLLLAAETS